MRTAVYTRIAAREAGREDLSLARQWAGVEGYAAARGWEIVRCYQDTGCGGTSRTRPGLSRLRADAEEGAFDVVVVWRLDRLMSGTEAMLSLAEWLEERGVSLSSVSEGIDTGTEQGRHLLRVGRAVLGQVARRSYEPASGDAPASGGEESVEGRRG